MSHTPLTFGEFSREWSPVRWAIHVWSWIALLALFITLEWFVDPLTASLALCLKLGWRDLLAAFRLRTHRNAAIAHSLGFYCLAQACFKVAVAGVAVTALVIAGEALLGVPQRIERCLAGCFLLLCGLIVGEAFVMFAAVRSVECRVAGWLDGTLYEGLFHRGPLFCRGTFNRIPWLLRTGMLLITLTFLPGPLVAIVMLIKQGSAVGLPAGIVFSLLWYWAIRPMRTALVQVAGSPQECWGGAVS